jgi:hypothetical protein
VFRVRIDKKIMQEDIDGGVVILQVRDESTDTWTDFHRVTDDAQSYTLIGNQSKVSEPKPAMYLRLFHGRRNPDENLNDWGLDGPVIGPCVAITSTYAAHVRLHDENDNELWLEYQGDLLAFDSIYYGDFAISTEKPTASLTVQQALAIQKVV